jgi:cytochrome c peroxidase
VTTHAPYLHDGRAKTLEEAIDFMLSGGIKNPKLDVSMKKVTLTAKERTDLIAFVKALEAPPEKFEPPTLP